MVTVELVEGVRFGRTTIVAVTGDLLEQGVAAVVFAANRRGVMAGVPLAGAGGLRSLGGSAIEREAMARAPLEVGTAIVTGAHGLEACGVEAIVHAVVHRALGEPARLEDVRRAVAAAVDAAHQRRLPSLALPLLGVESGALRGDQARFVAVIVEEVVGCLRRATLRLDRVVMVCRFEDHRALAAAALVRARERSWTLRR